MDTEREALVSLVRAAGGRATVEPVTILGLELLSPWAGDRRDFRARPDRLAAQLDPVGRDLLDLLDELGPLPSLPADHGYLAWLAHRRLALPVASLTKIPAWLADPALSGGWVALPPPRGYPQGPVDESVITADGRVAALHLLVTQAADTATPAAVPHAAVTTLLEWCLGPLAAQWSAVAGTQCARVRLSWQVPGTRAWRLTHTGVPVAQAQRVITRAVPIVSPSWRPPAPTPEQQQARAERERILAQGRADHAAYLAGAGRIRRAF